MYIYICIRNWPLGADVQRIHTIYIDLYIHIQVLYMFIWALTSLCCALDDSRGFSHHHHHVGSDTDDMVFDPSYIIIPILIKHYIMYTVSYILYIQYKMSCVLYSFIFQRPKVSDEHIQLPYSIYAFLSISNVLLLQSLWPSHIIESIYIFAPMCIQATRISPCAYYTYRYIYILDVFMLGCYYCFVTFGLYNIIDHILKM